MSIFVGSTVWRIFEKGDRGNYWVVKEKDDCLLVTASPFGGTGEYWFDITQFTLVKTNTLKQPKKSGVSLKKGCSLVPAFNRNLRFLITK